MQKDESDYMAIVDELHLRIEELTVRLYVEEQESRVTIAAPPVDGALLERFDLLHWMLGIDESTELPPMDAKPQRHDLPDGSKTNSTNEARYQWYARCLELSDAIRDSGENTIIGEDRLVENPSTGVQEASVQRLHGDADPGQLIANMVAQATAPNIEEKEKEDADPNT